MFLYIVLKRYINILNFENLKELCKQKLNDIRYYFHSILKTYVYRCIMIYHKFNYIICFLIATPIITLFIFPQSVFRFHLDINFQNISTKTTQKQTINKILKYPLDLSFNEFLRQYHYGHARREEIDGLEIHAYNRFGNDFFQCLRAIQYCDLFGFNVLIIPSSFLNIKSDFKIKNISVILRSNMHGHTYSHLVRGSFFYPLHKYNIDLDVSYSEYLKDAVSEDLEETNFGPDDLLMHIRSGDIFDQTKWAVNFYAQPPLNYYLDILSKKKWSNVSIIAENTNNPVINELVKKGYSFSQSSFKTDLSKLLTTENLVIGQGTIGIACVLLSKKLKNLYTFNIQSAKIINHWDCVPDERYQKEFFNISTPNRPASDIPILEKVMMTSKCIRWDEIVTGSNTHFLWRDADGPGPDFPY